MELSLNVGHIAIAALVGTMLLFVFLRFGTADGKKLSRLPPGPRPWPILGNLPLFGPLLHRDFEKLAKKYGPLVYVRLGSVDAVVVSSPDLAEEILKTKDLNFASRPTSSQAKILAYNQTNVGLAPYGPYWRHARKVFTLELMTLKRVQHFKKERKAGVLQALRLIIDETKDGKAIQLDHKLWMIMSGNVYGMALGKEFFGNSSKLFTDSQSREFDNAVRDMFEVLTLFVPGDFIFLLRYFDVHGYKKKMRKIGQKLDAIYEKIIEDHLQKNLKHDAAADDDDDKDLLDVLLTRPASDQKTPFTRDNVKSLLQDVVAGGTDTSVTTLGWTFAELLRNPSTLKRAQEELDTVVGRDRLVEETDLPSLQYVQAIVKEVFRLHPVTPLLLPHESLEASTLGDGYYIPKKCRVFVNTWAMGRDPTLWENPLEFNPERFLNARIDSNGQTFKFLPFGSGRRICPGKNLALAMVEYSLAVMLHACNWALPEGMSPEDLDMMEAPGLTMPKKIPLDVMASPLLPLNVIFSSESQ